MNIHHAECDADPLVVKSNILSASVSLKFNFSINIGTVKENLS